MEGSRVLLSYGAIRKPLPPPRFLSRLLLTFYGRNNLSLFSAVIKQAGQIAAALSHKSARLWSNLGGKPYLRGERDEVSAPRGLPSCLSVYFVQNVLGNKRRSYICCCPWVENGEGNEKTQRDYVIVSQGP